MKKNKEARDQALKSVAKAAEKDVETPWKFKANLDHAIKSVANCREARKARRPGCKTFHCVR